MIFWDSSAIVPLCVNEPATSTVKSILAEDPVTVVWWTTRTECISALVRQTREGSLTSVGERQARNLLELLVSTWIEIQPTGSLRAVAERLLAVHSLRAADAFQLAAALQWCRGKTTGMSLVCFDARLRSASYKEGFTIVPSE
ncbi:MAG: type II toxin-antitoxin system VapC family toxin [Candidatus Binatia bacterium]